MGASIWLGVAPGPAASLRQHADIRDLAPRGGRVRQPRSRSLQWEGPGVMLEATSPRGVVAASTSVRAPAADPGGCVQPRARLVLSASPPSGTLVDGGGHVTSFWWALRVFAMAVMPAATEEAHRAGS